MASALVNKTQSSLSSALKIAPSSDLIATAAFIFEVALRLPRIYIRHVNSLW